MKPKVNVTLRDIALKLDVSIVTVSKALRDHPDISHTTSQLVKQTALEMGYMANFMARNLSSNKSYTIGLVVPKVAHHFFSTLIESVYDTAFENNYEIILTVSQENENRELKHIQTLLSMRVDGLIVSLSEHTRNYSIFEYVRNSGIPLVFVDRALEMPKFSSITVDDRGGTFMAIEHAIKMGYTKIGHLGGFKEIFIGRRRYQGFKDAMEKYDLDINPDWVVFGGFSEKDGYEGFKKIYNSGSIPEFIFAVTYPVALGIYTAAAELKLRIPEDIDIICFGNNTTSRFISPALSCVDQPADKLGRRAVEVILEDIGSNDRTRPRHIEVPTKLIIRETCSAKNKIAKPKKLVYP